MKFVRRLLFATALSVAFTIATPAGQRLRRRIEQRMDRNRDAALSPWLSPSATSPNEAAPDELIADAPTPDEFTLDEAGSGGSPQEMPAGLDTPTGTDPDAKYTEPGYQDVSFGQATSRDAELADRLLAEEGDMDAAGERFLHESAGSEVLSQDDSTSAR